MAASIVLTGLASNDPVPGTYIQISFAQGSISGFQGNRPILLIGNKTPSGTATLDTVIYGPDTQVSCQLEQDVINLFGAGSELHRGWRRVTKWNNSTPIYLIAVTESSGSKATLALTLNVGGTLTGFTGVSGSGYTSAPTATVVGGGGTGATVSVQTSGVSPNITVTGLTVVTPGSGYTSVPTITFSAGNGAATAVITPGTPSAAGFVRIWGADTFTDTSFNAGDTLATITASAVVNINGNVNLPYTASQSTVNSTSDTILLTSKQKGLRGNWLRGMASVVPGVGASSNMTVTNTSDTFFTGGTTADSNATALATLNAKHFYYLVSAAEDATQLGALCSQVTSQALPTSGNRQRVFAGSVDTSGNVTTIATTINNPRAEFVWAQGSPLTPFELAANDAGIFALLENSGTEPRLNFSGYGNTAGDLWNVPTSRDTTLQPTRTTIKALLQSGVTPIGWSSPTKTYLVKRITSYSLNGSTPDYRIRDAGKVTVCDFFADDLYALIVSEWQGKSFADEPKTGQPPPGQNSITVGMFRSSVINLVTIYGQRNLFQNVDQIIATSIFQRDPANDTRMDTGLLLQPVSICDQFLVSLSQVA